MITDADANRIADFVVTKLKAQGLVAVSPEEEWLTVKEAAKFTGRSEKHLRLMKDRLGGIQPIDGRGCRIRFRKTLLIDYMNGLR